MTITLTDLLMVGPLHDGDMIVTKRDWAALGRGEITDQDMIDAILASDYDALED